MMNHLKWTGHSATILELQKKLHQDVQSCEVTLISKGYTAKGHRFVLSSSSDLLRCLLYDIPLDHECTIMVPDINGELLESIMTFIYLGETCLSSNHLSEFLEAISLLGIKSPISFDCTTSSSQSATINSTATQENNKNNSNNTVDGDSTLLLTPSEIMSQHYANMTLEPQNVMTTSSIPHQINSNREVEYLDVYHEVPQTHHRVTYCIEHIPDQTQGNEFMLTENSGHFSMTRNLKIETASSTQMDVTEEIDGRDMEDVNDVGENGVETHLVEEYPTSEDPLVNITECTNENISPNGSHMNLDQANASTIIQTPKPNNNRGIKLKTQSGVIIHPKLEIPSLNNNKTIMKSIMTPEAVYDDHNSLLQQTPDGSYSIIKDYSNLKQEAMSINECRSNDYVLSKPTSGNSNPVELAYRAMIRDNLSLPKAALKFNVSKTELWRRVRNTGVEHYLSRDTQSKLSRQEDAIDLACHAVIAEGYSLQKAAIKYDISKTVLWRRVRKHPNYMKTTKENPVVAKAYERLKSGESLKSISQDLDIPMSTLHRHKVRLSMQGQLPNFVTCRRRDSDTKDNLKLKLAKAVHACVHEGMSQNHAANLYQISKSTLWRHLQKRVAEAIGVNESMELMEEADIKPEIILS